MRWRPAPETGRYDKARVATLAPIREQIVLLRLPPLRHRQLSGLLNVLELQIEVGGDSPEVNGLLLDALRAGVRHQVDEQAAQPVLQAIDVFAQGEARRWEQVRAGTLPPIQLSPEEQLDEVMQQGYQLLSKGQTMAACDAWLTAWALVKQLAGTRFRSVEHFDRTYGLFQSVDNWCVDMAIDLGNAGNADVAYYEHQLRFSREYLDQFPEQTPGRLKTLLDAQGAALWRLGRRSEAESVYAALVSQLPDDGWAYISWADHYWLEHPDVKEYATAEAILRRALARPALHDRKDVLARLADLQTHAGKAPPPSNSAPQPSSSPAHRHPPAATAKPSQPPARKPGRNDPCWCGSGRKYKQCHLRADDEG